MKIRKSHLKAVALTALGVVLGRGAQAETVLDFESLPAGQTHNTAINQAYGDYASVSSPGVTVNGFGTPNLGVTWQATGGRWDYYIDTFAYIWNAAQLDSSQVGDRHEVVFTPNNPGVSVVVKSFNFHPYYNSLERFTYDVSVLNGSTVVSGPIHVSFLSDSTKNHPVDINYTGAAGQTLTLRLARVASTLGAGEIEGGAGNIAVDDITFAQLPETEMATGPSIVSLSPTNNQVAVVPVMAFRATLTNGTTVLATGSVRLSLNGNAVTPAVSQASDLTTVTYDAAGLLPSNSTNRFVLSYSDTGSPAKAYTNEIPFTVASYVDKKLPAPLYFENFDSTPEGSLPPGWSGVSYNDASLGDPTINFVNLDSAAYTNWTVVEASRFTGLFQTYSQGDATPAGEARDYQRVLTPSPSNVVNGAYVKDLATGRFVFADSGYRQDPSGQILFLFTPDFNLTGKTDVHLAFNSLWEQNQDSMGAVEYSIDRGATWLPIVYMLNQQAVLTNLDGSINPELTLGTNYNAVAPRTLAEWYDANWALQGGYYGAYIGVASNQWSTLAPYISPRADDNPVESKRVELFRLPQADNQAAVRFRFAHAGTDSWYFGIDNFGLYSIPPASLTISSIARSGNNVVISWTGASGTRLQQTTSLSAPNWQDVAGTDGASSATLPNGSAAAFFRLVRNN